MSNFKIKQVLAIEDVTHSSVDTDKFLVLSGGKEVEYRSGSEVLSDIGAQAAGTYLTTYNNSDNYAFKTILVSGQSDVVADSNTDSLTLIAGSNVTITTNATNNSITINSTAGTQPTMSWIIDISRDETTDLTTGDGKYLFRIPQACTIVNFKFWVTRQPTGSTISIDVDYNSSGTMLNNNVIIEDSAFFNSSAADIANPNMAEDDMLRFDLDQVGATQKGNGLKCAILYTM